MAAKNRIALSSLLAQLRRELLQAQGEAAGGDLRLAIEDIEIELTVETAKEAGGGGGVKFWVYNADAKVNASDIKTQRLKLRLKASDRTTGAAFDVADEDGIDGA